jgi:hypothetical protein
VGIENRKAGPMGPITVTLPLVKETKGALRYALADRQATAVSDLYVRKDKLREAGHVGPWPTEINVTVEVKTA